MNKSKLAISLDSIALYFCLFLLVELWCAKFIDSIILQLIFSLTLAFAILMIVSKIYKMLTKGKYQKISENTTALQISKTFSDSDPQKLYNFFYKAMSKKYICKKTSSNNNFIIETKKINLLFYFNFYEQISKIHLINLIDEFNNVDQIIVLSENFNKLVIDYASKTKKIKLMNYLITYKLLVVLNSFPKLQPKKSNFKFKDIIKTTFQRTNAKRFFKLSILFSIASFLLFYSIYYRIFASICIMLTIACLLFSKPQKANNEKLFFE